MDLYVEASITRDFSKSATPRDDMNKWLNAAKAVIDRLSGGKRKAK